MVVFPLRGEERVGSAACHKRNEGCKLMDDMRAPDAGMNTQLTAEQLALGLGRGENPGSSCRNSKSMGKNTHNGNS